MIFVNLVFFYAMSARQLGLSNLGRNRQHTYSKWAISSSTYRSAFFEWGFRQELRGADICKWKILTAHTLPEDWPWSLMYHFQRYPDSFKCENVHHCSCHVVHTGLAKKLRKCACSLKNPAALDRMRRCQIKRWMLLISNYSFSTSTCQQSSLHPQSNSPRSQ